MAENVTININANDKASGNIKKVTMNLREMGEKIGNVGRSMSMFFTVPVVGLVAGLTKLGSTASQTVNKLKQDITSAAQDVTNAQIDLNNAIIGGNQDQVRSAMETLAAAKTAYAGTLVAMDNTSEGVKRAAVAYDTLQASLAPIKYKLEEIGATLLETLIPVFQQMIPTIMDIVGKIGNAVTWFSNLDTGTKNLVLGFVAVVVAAGPVLMTLGEMIKVVGTLQILLGPTGLMTSLPAVTGMIKGLGVAVYAAVGPWGLLAAAVAGLIYVLITQGPQALATLDKMVLLAGRLVLGDQWFNQTRKQMGYASGGFAMAGVPITVGERGSETFVPKQNGMILPHGSGAGVVNIYLTYSPTIGLASKLEAETKLAPYIKAALRKAGY